MGEAGLQAALPRELYVDPQAWSAERDARAVRRVVLPRPRSTTSAWPARGGCSASTSPASRCSSPATRTARLHAAYNVCRHRGSQLPAARRRPRLRRRSRCAAPTTRGPTASTGGCSRRRTRRSATRRSSRCTRWASTTWGGFVFVHLTPRAGDAPRRAGRQGRRRRSPTTASPTLVTGSTLTLRRGRQLQGAAGELQRVLPLRAGAPRAVAAGAGVRRRRRRPRLGRRRPAPRGCVDLHHDGHHDARAACPASTSTSAPATRATSSTRT